MVEVADVGQVGAPFEGDQPGVGQAFGQLQPAAVGYYAVTSVVQYECGCAHRRQEGFDVGGVDGREISGGHVAVGRFALWLDREGASELKLAARAVDSDALALESGATREQVRRAWTECRFPLSGADAPVWFNAVGAPGIAVREAWVL